MKRSPSSSCSSSSSSSSSISEIQEELVNSVIVPKRAKRVRKRDYKKDQDSGGGGGAKRSSVYRGVTRHRWTGRFEAHLWDKSCWNNAQKKKGRQVYLGAYDSEEAAAHTYDLAALKYWGPTTILNFSIDNYTKEIEEMEKATKEEYLASLRRRSSGFSRGVSKYRGVARHHHNGRWEARIGRVFGNKYLYLGTYKTQEEAAVAYDIAAIEYRGANAVTNFDINNYADRFNKKDQQTASPEPGELEDEELEHLLRSPAYHPPSPSPPLLQEQVVSAGELRLQSSQIISSMDSTSMDAAMLGPPDENNLRWSFLDNSGLDHLPLPDLPTEPLEMYGDFGFEDMIDVDFLFESDEPSDEIVGGDPTVEVKGEIDDHQDNKERVERVSSPWSSSTTTTSVSSV
ncbi:hypothetical protein UlMin_025301 [Ulmus minor]